MIIYPAIDIKDGKCVRLQQGDFNQLTVYAATPVEQAKLYEAAGAEYIHLVDLDGAKDGEQKNFSTIKKIVEAVSIPVQVGGGIRSEKAIVTLLSIGVRRVIIGTKAITDINFLSGILKKYPGKIIVSIDVRDGFVAVDGWVVTSEIKAIDFCQTLVEHGVETIVYTDISKDGMMEGIESSFYQQLKQNFSVEIIASGGVSTMRDIQQLQQKGIDGAIIGKALYLDKIPLQEAIIVARGEV